MTKRSWGAAAAASGLVFAFACGRDVVNQAPPYQRADIVMGARLFDNWMKIKGVTTTAVNPGYALTQGSSKSVTSTWRCTECHGWDYQGKDGKYATGSHFTGVQGVFEAKDDPAEKIFATVHDGVEGKAMTAFGAKESFTEQEIWDITRFVKEGLVDLRGRIDLSTTKVIGADIARGKTLFEKGIPGTSQYGTCAYCHGIDGKKINTHTAPQAPEYLMDVVSDPWQFTHHVRFGYAGGELMPSFYERGWTLDDVLDVVAYVQTLPH